MKRLQGVVVRTGMKKTAAVRIDRQWAHPVYQKTIKRSKTYLVQDDQGVRVGDVVQIEPCRPMSARKQWRIVRKEGE